MHKSEEEEGTLDWNEIRSQCGDIWLILEIHLSRCVESEEHLITRLDTPAVELVRPEYIGVVEVAHAAAAPIHCVVV